MPDEVRERAYAMADRAQHDEGANDGDDEREVVIDRFRIPRSLEPTMLPDPSSKRPSGLGMLFRLGAAIALAITIAWLVAGRLPGLNLLPDRLSDTTSGPIADGTSQLVIATPAPAAVDDLIPLGISLANAANGDAIVLSGLPDGSNITGGRPVGSNGWHLYAYEIDGVAIRPAPGFVGDADITVELQHRQQVVDRRPLHLEWTGAPGAMAVPSVMPPQGAAPMDGATVRRLPADEVTALLRRGQDLVASGDLAAARLLLQRAAEASDARAALALAATYDPVVLEQMRTQGIAADPSLARSWYERAKQFGSAEATRRLEVLAASHDR
jgi:hypothetical protein